MIFKTIRVEFHEPWGKGFRTFYGWSYYMVSGDSYKFYEISPTDKDHKLTAEFPRSKIKQITETFI